MKKNKILLFGIIFIVLIGSILLLILLGSDDKDEEQNNNHDEPTLLEFIGVSFSNDTVTFDGEEHTIYVENAPEFADVTYTNQGPFVNAGEYVIEAKVSADGYKDLNLSAKLVINKANIEGITFNDLEVDYTGNSYEVKIIGDLPAGADVKYTSNVSGVTNSAINAGDYTLTATITAPNYNDLVLESTLLINKIDFSNITFDDITVDYDGNSHQITVLGNLPSDATVIYTCDVNGITNSAIEVGKYNVTATINAPNFNELVLTAKLTIKATDEERFLLVSGNTLFFQNAIDEDKLYAYNFDTEELLKVSNDKAIEINEYDEDSIIYISKTLLLSSIKTASYDGNATSNSTVLNKSVQYIQYAGEEVIYFVINGLTNDKSGIYKADFSTEEPTITCLSIGKAKDLRLYGDYLYFVDNSNDGKLSKIGVSSVNQTRVVVLDEKINNLELIDGVLYFNIDNLTGNYISKYTISTGVCRKLTSDAGINFTVVDGYLYYVNIDLLTSNIFGNGIYKVNANPLTDNILPGSKVIDGGSLGVCSLTSLDNYLIYYDVDGYKLMQYSIEDETSVNLLEGFVKPADPTPTSFGSQVVLNNDVIYYLDIYDGKTLHSYNPVTKANYRLTSEKVDNFAVVGDYIYFNMVSYGVNNDTYRMNYKTGGIPELVNEFDSIDLVSDGNYIYYIERNVAGVAKSIHKANLDGSSDVVIFEYAADNLVLYNGTLYFTAKPNAVQTIMKIENVAEVNTLQSKVCVNDDYACDVFTIENGVFYFRHNYGILYKNHRLAKMNIDGTGYQEIVTDATDPTEIVVSNGYVYYVNSADTANDYDLYKISINGTEGSQIELTVDMYASSICVYDDNVYFVNYYLGGTLGDSYLYSVSINGGEVTKIA